MKKLSRNKFRYGSVTVIFILVFIAAAVLLNVVASVATDRFGLRFDLTDSRIYEISDETKRLLQTDLQEEIKITVLSEENVYINNESYSPIREVLLRYRVLAGDKITVEYIDPYVNPEIVEKYNDLGTPNYQDIVVESGKRYKVLNPVDLYAIRTDYETEQDYIAGLQAEQKLSSAILYCTIEQLPLALKVAGHGETNLVELNSLLSSGNYKVDSINLSVADIPAECEMLIIAAPITDFTPEEIVKLDNFFARNGNAMIFYNINTPELPVFERFMADWGVRYENLLIADSAQSISHPANLAPALLSHAMTENLASTSEYVVVPAARQISMLYEQQGWKTVSPILISSSSSYGKLVKGGETISSYTKESGDITGPFFVSVLTEQNIVKNYENNYSRILFCSTGMATDDILSIDAFLNSRFFIRAINYMNESADAIVVEPRYYTSAQLNILGNQAMVVFWTLVVIIPLGTLGLGVFMWFRRRNL